MRILPSDIYSENAFNRLNKSLEFVAHAEHGFDRSFSSGGLLCCISIFGSLWLSWCWLVSFGSLFGFVSLSSFFGLLCSLGSISLSISYLWSSLNWLWILGLLGSLLLLLLGSTTLGFVLFVGICLLSFALLECLTLGSDCLLGFGLLFG